MITNPDMLHAAILPHHTKWFQLFEQLRVIVIDELHTYRGVFGSHVANVLRRLLRICAHYGSHPVVVTCSATIDNTDAALKALLEASIDRLPAAYRSVFVMREIEELSTAETAEALGVSEEVVKTRLHRARKDFLALVGEEGGG